MQIWQLFYIITITAAAAKSLQSCPTLRPHWLQPTRLPRPWDSPGKNTGVGCHFLLQCMKGKSKSESEVVQSCPTLFDPMDCSLPGSSITGILQARALEWGAIAFSELLLLQFIITWFRKQILKVPVFDIPFSYSLSVLFLLLNPTPSSGNYWSIFSHYIWAYIFI